MDTADTAELLAQLKDIHLPPAPVTPGLWPLYLSVGLCLVFLLVWLTTRLRQHRSWHTEALGQLAHLQQLPAGEALPQTAALLKRIVLTHDKQFSVRQLHGESWLRYLDQFFSTDFFSHGQGRVFGNALYKPHIKPDEQLYRELRRLIKKRGRKS